VLFAYSQFDGFELGEVGDFHHPDSYRDDCGERIPAYCQCDVIGRFYLGRK